MSIPMHDPLRVVPPPTYIKTRMSWLLRLRRAARRGLDAALAVPRAAAGYMSRLTGYLRLQGTLRFLQNRTARVIRPLGGLGQRLGGSGAAAAVIVLLTSDSGRAIVRRTGRAVGRGLSWIGRTAYGLVDRCLRCLGRPGQKAADALFSVTVRFGGRLAVVAAPVVHQVAGLTDPTSPFLRLLSGLSRSYLLHRLVKGVVSNRLLRSVAEAVMVPAILDSRLVVWLRDQVRQTRVRVEALRRQEDDVDQLPLLDEDNQPVVEDWEPPIPSNRADRRAAQRQQGKRPPQ